RELTRQNHSVKPFWSRPQKGLGRKTLVCKIRGDAVASHLVVQTEARSERRRGPRLDRRALLLTCRVQANALSRRRREHERHEACLRRRERRLQPRTGQQGGRRLQLARRLSLVADEECQLSHPLGVEPVHCSWIRIGLLRACARKGDRHGGRGCEHAAPGPRSWPNDHSLRAFRLGQPLPQRVCSGRPHIGRAFGPSLGHEVLTARAHRHMLRRAGLRLLGTRGIALQCPSRRAACPCARRRLAHAPPSTESALKVTRAPSRNAPTRLPTVLRERPTTAATSSTVSSSTQRKYTIKRSSSDCSASTRLTLIRSSARPGPLSVGQSSDTSSSFSCRRCRFRNRCKQCNVAMP